MKRTELIMGMPISIVIPRKDVPEEAFAEVFAWFRRVDERFSPYKPESEVSRIDRGELPLEKASAEMRKVLDLAEETRQLTEGYFNVRNAGRFDPSGLVKGWSIFKAARFLDNRGYRDFCIDAGGDIEVRGRNGEAKPWEIGLRNPFAPGSLIRVLELSDCGIATSGTYIRGDHIYNPRNGGSVNEIASITVVADNVYEADRLATAAFAMGERGIAFLAELPGIDAYMVDRTGSALFTPGLARYIS